jgi:hypothetical protein
VDNALNNCLGGIVLYFFIFFRKLLGGSHMAHHHHDHSLEHEHSHEHTLKDGIICHLPYAIFSVAFCLTILSFLSYITLGISNGMVLRKGAHMLFHAFHFLHIVFAATGTLITFYRYSKNVLLGLFVGVICSTTFCTLSDAIIPYLSGRLLGVQMSFHLCFVSELHNVLPFLVLGLLNGFLMGRYHQGQHGFYSIFSHFIHILISSFASTFYLVAHGLPDWYSKIGIIFLFLIIAVVIPCTLSDVVVPMAFARVGKGNERD